MTTLRGECEDILGQLPTAALQQAVADLQAINHRLRSTLHGTDNTHAREAVHELDAAVAALVDAVQRLVRAASLGRRFAGSL